MNNPKHTLLFSFSVAVLLAAPGRAATDTNAAAESKTAASTPLPVTEISLYSSGVGFFERDGQVEGRAQVDLRFKTDDINDLLKSMVVRDPKSERVASVTYGSRDPLTRTLRSFGLDLTENPTLGQLLNQARGEEVTLQWPTPLTGTILGVEKKKQPVGENKDMDVEYLNVVTGDGLQSIPLPQVTKVKLLNERLDAELHQALTLLAASHDKDKKTVSIAFDGEGKRDVAVSYVVQTPVWKTSYRLVVDEKPTPFLQGWAIVENTTDEDWTNVKLALVSGRPISFVMDLYEPLFATRPVVQPELFRFLRPQVYQDVIEVEKAPAAAPVTPGGARGGRAGGAGGGGGFGGGGGAGRGAGVVLAPAAMPAAPPVQYAAEGAMNREFDLQTGVASEANTAQTGELFTYQIKTPVTLARQRSAMLPIVNQNIAGEKVSIYNESAQAKFPFNGVRLTNTTGLHLMQGPITVFEAGAYAGDARIEDLAPGADRLLSYGVDLATEVDPENGAGRNDLLTVVIHKGAIIATRKYSEEKTYNIRSHDQKKKTLIIEHPYRSDWTVVEPKEKPERTRDVYRFTVPVEAGAQTKLVVRQEKQVSETAILLNTSNEGLEVYLRAQKISAAVKDALHEVAAMRNTLSQTTSDRERSEQRISEITQEQARIRENMARLSQTSDLYNSYVKELTQQESDLASLREKIETLKDTETKQQRKINDYILNLDVE
ncbi:MAG: DUF4139 domain-containing protein [Verrucomicrobiota bacterium]|jgi:hypothetical protein